MIGIITPETRFLARVGENVTFDENTAGVVQTAVDALTAQGINKIILLGHLSYRLEQELAGEVSGIDVMLGADNETLLSNIYAVAGGRYTATVEGPYPTIVESAGGEPVLVVQAFRHNRYLGRLDVVFDGNGVLTTWNGDAILMSRFISPDPEVAALVAELREPLDELLQEVIGQSQVFLVGDRDVCRYEECNLGNLIADALREETGAQIAIMNGGGIRANIPVDQDMPAEINLDTPIDVTLGDVLTVLPFGNRTSTFELRGADIIGALENGLSRIDFDSGTGRFAQVSGLRYRFDGSQPVGSRIVSVEVLNENGDYEPIDPEAVYRVASNDFLRQGGDEYTMFAENGTNADDSGRELDVVIAEYIANHSPVAPVIEGRITQVDGP